jgi:hypothetical protein
MVCFYHSGKISHMSRSFAIRASDGKLLDMSQIVWFNDPDDDEPMAPATTSLTAQRQASMSRTTTTLDWPPQKDTWSHQNSDSAAVPQTAK